ncbi:hypothetical protein [Streptomyces sp. NBC_01477]|uniref:hypothetical protein n=1 Tax=Streptomyces sp. NBC_01477 TaxID=2976015 RepID=UPI002E33A7A2|nr:hypothetical protein [Streptomyces sp. NBC_01477]
MRKRAVIVIVAVLCVAAGLYTLYYVSPIGQHNRQAAHYEHQVRGSVMSLGDVQVTSGGHRVSGNLWGEGGECSVLATFEVNTTLAARDFEDHLKSVLRQRSIDYVYEQVKPLGGRSDRLVLRVEVGTLTAGGSLDPRCG